MAEPLVKYSEHLVNKNRFRPLQRCCLLLHISWISSLTESLINCILVIYFTQVLISEFLSPYFVFLSPCFSFLLCYFSCLLLELNFFSLPFFLVSKIYILSSWFHLSDHHCNVPCPVLSSGNITVNKSDQKVCPPIILVGGNKE